MKRSPRKPRREVHVLQEASDVQPENSLITAQRTIVVVFLIALGTLVVPQAHEAFRLPKDLALRAEGILLLSGWGLLAVHGWRPHVTAEDKPVLWLAALALGWTLLTTLTSVNRIVSVDAFSGATVVAITAMSTYFLFGSRRRVTDLAVLLIPAVVNAVLAILQATSIWSPVKFDPSTLAAMRITALIGNPNDTGSYLVAPLLVCVAIAVTSRRLRWYSATAAVILLLGVIAANTATAMVACAAGLVSIAIVGSTRPARVIAAVVVATLLFAAIIVAAGRVSLRDVRQLRRIEVLNNALSYRVPPFISAWRMFKDHPILGVGPGCFGLSYFDYKIAVEHDHPTLFRSGEGWSSFAQVHNDHLQVLAETGAPGYLLFATVLVFIGKHSFRSKEREPSSDEIRRLVRLIAFPCAVALAVLCLAQFPLQLSSTVSCFSFLFSLIIGWCRR